MKDLIIIGAGPGGYEMALAAAKSGLSVLLIEKEEVGGTCLHSGCIPTKAYHRTAYLLKTLKEAIDFGIKAEHGFDFQTNLERKNRIVKELTEGIKFMLKRAGVELIYGEAKLESKTKVAVEGDIYEGKNIVIATGSRPARLPFGDIRNPDIITSKEILSEKTPPKKLVIVGAGVVGIEIATIFNQFGSNVEVIEALDTILPSIDREVSKRLAGYLKQQGIKIHLSARVKDIRGNKVIFTKKDEEHALHFDKLLIAIGRVPNVENIGLDKVGIKYAKKGIAGDENFQTNVPNIYAIGDVTGKMMLAHSATYAGFHVLKHILGETSGIDFSLLPACVFSFPEVATVGLSEEECSDQNPKTYKFQYLANGKARALGEPEGFLKVVTVGGEVRGVHIIGAGASDLIHQAVVLMNKKGTVEELSEMIFAHPTLSETFGHFMR
jgi:dihydrolipoamide dehydrogenase